MQEVYERYMKTHEFSNNSVETYTRNIESFLNHVAKPECEVNSNDIDCWIEGMSNYSSATINQKIACVKSYFDILVEYNLVAQNPIGKRTAKPKVVNKEKHHMTSEQVRAMINSAHSTKMKAIISLAASSGLRVGELTNLTLNDYKTMRSNGEHKMYIVGKGNKRAPVIFNEQSCCLIDDYIKIRDDRGTGCEYLFVSREGNRIARNNLNASLKIVARDAGISWYEQFCPHQLRAATATILSDRDVPVMQIRDIMRHSSVSTTNRYVKLSEQNVENNVMSISF